MPLRLPRYRLMGNVVEWAAAAISEEVAVMPEVDISGADILVARISPGARTAVERVLKAIRTVT